MVVILILWTGSNRSGPTVSPHQLVIQDTVGRNLLDIATYSDDSYGMSLRRPNGGTLAALFAINDMPEFGFYDNRDKSRLRMHLRDSENSPEILLLDSSQIVRATLSLRSDQTPVLSFFDTKQKNRLAFGLGKSGWPDVSVFDESERCRFAVYATEEGLPAVVILSNDGKEKQSFVWSVENGYANFRLAE